VHDSEIFSESNRCGQGPTTGPVVKESRNGEFPPTQGKILVTRSKRIPFNSKEDFPENFPSKIPGDTSVVKEIFPGKFLSIYKRSDYPALYKGNTYSRQLNQLFKNILLNLKNLKKYSSYSEFYA
jgi:hypothetical protein